MGIIVVAEKVQEVMDQGKRTSRRENADNSDSKRLKVEQSDHPSGSELNENSEQELGSGSEGLEVKEGVWLVLALVLVLVVRKPLGKSTPPRLSTSNNNNNKNKMIHLMKPIHWDQLKKINSTTI